MFIFYIFFFFQYNSQLFHTRGLYPGQFFIILSIAPSPYIFIHFALRNSLKKDCNISATSGTEQEKKKESQICKKENKNKTPRYVLRLYQASTQDFRSLFSILLLFPRVPSSLFPAIRSVGDVVNVVIIIPAARPRELGFYGFWIKRAGRAIVASFSAARFLDLAVVCVKERRADASHRSYFSSKRRWISLSCSSNSTPFHYAYNARIFFIVLFLFHSSLVVFIL